MRVQCTCSICGTGFTRWPSRIRERNFCSRPCQTAGVRPARLSPLRPSAVCTDGLTAQIPLYGHDGSIRAYTVIDAADVPLVSQWCWNLASGYASRYVGDETSSRFVYLHRQLLGLTEGDRAIGDHINRDKLDNRRKNLRAITAAGNAQNRPPRLNGTSKYRGVSWDRKSRKWRASVMVNGKTVTCGRFDDEEQAARSALESRLRLLPCAVD